MHGQCNVIISASSQCMQPVLALQLVCLFTKVENVTVLRNPLKENYGLRHVWKANTDDSKSARRG